MQSKFSQIKFLSQNFKNIRNFRAHCECLFRNFTCVWVDRVWLLVKPPTSTFASKSWRNFCLCGKMSSKRARTQQNYLNYLLSLHGKYRLVMFAQNQKNMKSLNMRRNCPLSVSLTPYACLSCSKSKHPQVLRILMVEHYFVFITKTM